MSWRMITTERTYTQWIDGDCLNVLIARATQNKELLYITRTDSNRKLHSAQHCVNDTMKYFIHGVQVTRRQWKQYIKIWK